MKRYNLFYSLLLMMALPAFAGPPIVEPGYHQTPFVSDEDTPVQVGFVEIWNTPQSLEIKVHTTDGWQISDKLRMFIHHDLDQVPLTKKGGLEIKSLPYEWKIDVPVDFMEASFDLQDDLEFNWGKPWYDEHVKYIAVYTEALKDGLKKDVWAFGGQILPGSNTAMAVPYPLYHPSKGHFIDSPVGGVTVISKTLDCKTDESGGFDYFPGERVELYLGHLPLGDALAAHKISPLDIFESADTDDPRVINMARLLQSLDADASPKDGIMITEAVEFCLFEATEALGLSTVDFANDAQIEDVIQGTIAACAGEVSLVAVSAEDAKANLDRSLNANMFRKNASKTPNLVSSKSKLNIMGQWFPALRANGDPSDYMDESGLGVLTGIPYYDENGDLIRVATQAKPIVAVYTDAVEETGSEDIFAGVSRDDGQTFKRKNLSRAADKSSFTLANGTEYFGQAKKPVFQVKGNNVLVAWTSKFCRGGKPTYAITTCDDPDTEIVETPDADGLCRITCKGTDENEVCEPDYPHDDPFFHEDYWGVGGPQRSVDYTEQGFPEVGEVPYSCVWTARGTVVNQGMINSGGYWADKLVGDIVWFKPERLTSGRRDANQVFMGASDGAGFAIAWQEDPEGLRPGDAAGPGPGWGGATTNHKTDIWYSYITMADFRKIDTNFLSGGDPEHELDISGRPKTLVPMSLPVRLTDNDTVNTDNLLVELGEDGLPVEDENGDWIPILNPDTEADGDSDGTHAYGYRVNGLCSGFHEFVNNAGDLKKVCITEDGRLLNGDTGASRPNLFMQTYTKPDGTKSAWAIMAYEETKGAGEGSPDHEPDEGPYGDEPVIEEGKNAIYHSFDFQNPDKVNEGTIINLPERDADGNLVYLREVSQDADGNVVYGDLILDYQGLPQLAYENARRPRFILQGKSAMGDSKTSLLILYKEGKEGHGRPSDIMLRRVVANTSGNPYKPENIVCKETELANNGRVVCVKGVQNMSTVNPTLVTPSMGEPTSDDPYGAVKVLRWAQTPDELSASSGKNPYEDARAHRGGIRGDFVVMGYSYTPNWAASRNGHDKYDLFVRRSFDGGQTWTTDPDGEGVTHCQSFKTLGEDGTLLRDLEGDIVREEVCTDYANGEFEQAHNLSQMKNSKESVIEPRIVATPGTIKDPATGEWTGIAEDKQNKNVFYVTYGTATNPPVLHGDTDEVQEYPVPLDLLYSFSRDKGESYALSSWVVNPDSDGYNAGETVYRWGYLARGDAEQGEAQIRMTPDGSRFYSTWLEEGNEGSDIQFRRIMSSEFPGNVANQD